MTDMGKRKLQAQESRKSPVGNDSRVKSRDDQQSFRSLEVYQIAQSIAIEIVKDLSPQIAEVNGNGTSGVLDRLVSSALSVPEKIAQSSGSRLRSKKMAAEDLFEVTQICSRMVVYLDQAAEMYLEDQEAKDHALDLLRRVFLLRVKIVNLLKTWVELKPYGAQGQGEGRYQDRSGSQYDRDSGKWSGRSSGGYRNSYQSGNSRSQYNNSGYQGERRYEGTDRYYGSSRRGGGSRAA